MTKHSDLATSYFTLVQPQSAAWQDFNGHRAFRRADLDVGELQSPSRPDKECHVHVVTVHPHVPNGEHAGANIEENVAGTRPAENSTPFLVDS